MEAMAPLHSQLEFMPLEEERLLRIKEEFQATVTGIQSAMMLAISDYDKKCNDYESLRSQLNEERNRTKSLEMQLDQLKECLKQKDELISKLQPCKDNGEQSGECIIDQMKDKMEKPNEMEMKNREFEIKLRNILDIVKPGRKSVEMAKNIRNGSEQKTKAKKRLCETDSCPEKDNNASDRNATKFKWDHSQQPKFHNQMECKFTTESNKRQLNKSYVALELNRIIGENRAIIAGLKKVQRRK